MGYRKQMGIILVSSGANFENRVRAISLKSYTQSSITKSSSTAETFCFPDATFNSGGGAVS